MANIDVHQAGPIAFSRNRHAPPPGENIANAVALIKVDRPVDVCRHVRRRDRIERHQKSDANSGMFQSPRSRIASSAPQEWPIRISGTPPGEFSIAESNLRPVGVSVNHCSHFFFGRRQPRADPNRGTNAR